MLIKMIAIFPETKLLHYTEVIHFENFTQNLNIIDTIKYFGIDPFFLDKNTLLIHPKDILITKPEMLEIEDNGFRSLFHKHAQVYKIDLEIDISEIYFPLTSIFVSRFEILGIEWLNNYFLTLCDYDVNKQTRVSLKDFFKLQQIDINNDEFKRILNLFIKKYVFAVNLINPQQIIDIQKIDNPFFIDPDPMSYETK